jgi:hypothetical protein
MPFVYLVQPCELVGTNRYKIGMSNQDNLNRLKSYKNGSRYLCFFEQSNALKIEKQIKEEFNKKYKLIAGKEYFQSDDEKEMIKLFTNIVFGYNEITSNNNQEIAIDVKSWMSKFKFSREKNI